MTAALSYAEFLAAKAQLAAPTGLDVDPAEVHPLLKPHQWDTVVWAVRGGRRAIFAAFGLGKSLMQLEVCRLTLAKSGGQRQISSTVLDVFRRAAAQGHRHWPARRRLLMTALPLGLRLRAWREQEYSDVLGPIRQHMTPAGRAAS